MARAKLTVRRGRDMVELEIKPSVLSRFRVTVVVLAGVAIAGVLVSLLLGGGAGLFERKIPIYTYMPDATGLAKGSQVFLSGIPVGKVTKVDVTPLLDPQRAVRVDMRIRASYLPNIPIDSQTSISSDTIVGYKYVAIAQGKSPVTAGANTTLPSEPLKIADVRADIVRSLHDEMKQVDDLLVQVTSPKDPVGRFVITDDMYRTVLGYVRAFDQSVRESFGPNGAGPLIFSDADYAGIRQKVLRLDETLLSIQRGEGSAGRLFADDKQYNDTLAQLRGLRTALTEANSGKGRFGQLLHDETQYRAVRKMLTSTDSLLDALNAGESPSGQLLRNPQAYESLLGALRELRATIGDLRANPKKYLVYKPF